MWTCKYISMQEQNVCSFFLHLLWINTRTTLSTNMIREGFYLENTISGGMTKFWSIIDPRSHDFVLSIKGKVFICCPYAFSFELSRLTISI